MAEKKIKISTHDLIPEHTKLSDSEKQKILDQYNVTINELPSILITDAALLKLKVKVGDIIKIERKSPTSGKSIFYRGVVEWIKQK